MMDQFMMIVLLSGLLCVHVTSEQIENNRTDNIETSVDSRTVQSIDRTPESKLVAPDHFSFKQKYKELKESGMIYVILAFEILLLLIFVGTVVGGIYSCPCFLTFMDLWCGYMKNMAAVLLRLIMDLLKHHIDVLLDEVDEAFSSLTNHTASPFALNACEKECDTSEGITDPRQPPSLTSGLGHILLQCDTAEAMRINILGTGRGLRIGAKSHDVGATRQADTLQRIEEEEGTQGLRSAPGCQLFYRSPSEFCSLARDDNLRLGTLKTYEVRLYWVRQNLATAVAWQPLLGPIKQAQCVSCGLRRGIG